MKLQDKALAIFTILFAALLIVVCIFASSTVISSYTSLEKQYVQKDLDQTVKKLADEENTLSAVVSDWGPWDDSYNFVKGNKSDFVKANLVPDTYNNLHLNIIIITNDRGEIMYEGAYDLSNQTMVDFPAFFNTIEGTENPLMNMSDPRHSTSGLLITPTYPMIIASRPIVHTDFSGPPNGVVIMGRYLDPEEVQHLAGLTQPSLNFTPLGSPALSSGVLENLKFQNSSTPTLISPAGTDQIEGYALLNDIYGKKALVISFSEPRDIYAQGLGTTLNFILIILAIGLVFGIIAILILSRLVISPLQTLSNQVDAIGRDQTVNRRVDIDGDDEFSGLALQINRMLDTIEETQHGLLASETRFRELAGLLPQIVFEMDLNGRLLYVNKAGVDEFGVTEQKIASGATILEYISPQNFEQMKHGLAVVRGGGKSPGEVYDLKRSDGSIMKALVTTSLIHREGIVTGFRGVVVDITERILLKEQLEESTNLLSGILQASPVGVFRLDPDGHVIFVNATFSKITGISSEEIKGKYWADILHPDDRERLLTELRESIRARRLTGSETRYYHKNGTLFWLYGQTVPIFDSSGSLAGWVGTITDITERKKMEEALAENETYLKNLLTSVQVGIVVIDVDTFKIVDANPAALAMIGAPREKVLENVCHRFICPSMDGECPVIDKGRVLDNAERILLTCDGRRIPIIKYVVPVLLHGRQCLLETFIDNSYRKQIEQQLKESEEKYRALTESTPDILFSTDGEGRVTYVSPQINQYGYLAEEIIGKSLFDIIHAEDRYAVSENYRHELEERAAFSATFRIIDKWGNIHWFEEKSFQQLDEFGAPGGVYGMFRDITERKRAEDAIELANKKLNLMNNITRHDILNTLTGLLGCVDMADATMDNAERTALLSDIKDLARIIQRQINFTKQYQEVGVHLPNWQNITELVNRVLINFKTSDIKFVIDLESVEIYADPLLEKVFYNLIDNAIRYGKHITTIKFYFLISDKGLSLICEDDGVGIETGYKHYIFERGVGQNTGMGLFLTREILGITRIEIEENGIPGKGARFEILIPRGAFRFGR